MQTENASQKGAADLETGRLIAAMAESIGRLAKRYNVPGSDMDYLAATTVVGELLRCGNPAQVRDLYAAGYVLGLRLAAITGHDTARAGDIAHLQRLPATIPELATYTASLDFLHDLKQLLSSLVSTSAYPSSPDGSLRDTILSLSKWEGELLKLPASAITATVAEHDPRQVLESSARTQGGVFDNAKVVETNKLIGGFANETTLFKLSDKDGQLWDLVARASIDLQIGIDGREIGGEFFLLRYLYQNGVSVAEPLWLEQNVEQYGAKFLVTRKVEGSNFGTVVQAQRLSPLQIKALATELAKIHTLPLDKSDADFRQSHIDMELVGVSTTEAVSNYLERWVTLWRSTGLENSPTVEATLHWLRANLPKIDDAPVLVHGDYGVHNILLRGDKIGGVLDWEMSHLGDGAEDISWILSSFPDDADAKEFIRHYIEAGGRPVTEFQLGYYRVFGYFKMYVVMLEAQLRFDTLPNTHTSLLVLGYNFIQTPALQMAEAIQNAEKSRTGEKNQVANA